MDIKKLLEMQADLDKEILKNANVKEYPKDSIELALLVELGELANEIKSFKYWQKNKHIDRAKILEEFADCLHFALSLQNYYGDYGKWTVEEGEKAQREYNKTTPDEITLIFQSTYNIVISDPKYALQSILALGICLDITSNEMEEAYIKKNKENYRRQAEGY